MFTEVESPEVGEVWLDSNVHPMLVLSQAEHDPVFGPGMIDFAWLKDGAGKGQWDVTVSRSADNGLDRTAYVDCAHGMMSTTSNVFIVRVGTVDDLILKRISGVRQEMLELWEAGQRENTIRVRRTCKFDYDVALSFSGSDRSTASSLANELTRLGLRVFYDEYEKANLWGKDLVQHLDHVYRETARFCVVVVSAEYAKGMWTNHELKSALARSLRDSEDYLLPIRLDGTALPGLRPTVGHLDLRDTNLGEVAALVAQKIKARDLALPSSFSSKWLTNIVQINRLWNINCILFRVDRRYLISDEEPGCEFRIGISFEVNHTVPRTGFLALPEVQTTRIFVLHAAMVEKNGNLDLWDMELDALPAPETDNLEEADRAAARVLSEISDEQFVSLASEASTKNTIYVSNRYQLDEFDISSGR
jgi:TIR domain